jgi:hypothetical protein
MDFHPSRLRRGEVVAGASALALLVFMLVEKWYGTGGGSRSGWESLVGLRWLLLATIAAAFGLVITQATRRAPAVPVTISLLVAVLGVISVLALIYRVLINPSGHEQAGAFLGLISAIGIAYGGYLSLRQEGIARRDAPREIPVVRPGRENGA